MIVFCDTLGVYGGSQTLLLRMCKWLREKNYKTAIICSDIDNKEIFDKLQSINVTIIQSDMRRIRDNVLLFKELDKIEAFRVISFGWNNYINVEIVKKRSKLEFDNYIYCIHPETFVRGQLIKSSLFKKYIKYTYGKMYSKMLDNNSVIMMDEVNLDRTKTFFDTKNKKTPDIVYLPMICKDVNNSEEIICRGYNKRIIMTATRAEFPMKGYVLGLVDDFHMIRKSYPDAKLVIISAGDDLEMLRRKIEDSPEKENISLHGWMDYDRLISMIDTCTVFVGMGTSVLDAALRYKPAMAVSFFTYECLSEDFISNLPLYVDTRNEGCVASSSILIQKVLSMSYEEYNAECIRSYFSVKSIYDIDNNLEAMINHSTNKKKCILNRCEIVRQYIYNYINIWRTKNIKSYSYTELYKEP